MDLINKQKECFIGSNAFSANIYETKVVQGIILAQSYKAIVGCVQTNHFISVKRMTKGELKYHLDAMKYYKKKPYLLYEVNIAVLYMQHVLVGKYLYIVIDG